MIVMAVLLAGCADQAAAPPAEGPPPAAQADPAQTGDAQPGATPAIAVDPDLFVEGSLYFVAFHELGHAFVSEFDLPIVGREEDVVDRLAIWMMTPEDASPPDYLVGAMRGWFMEEDDTSPSDVVWWGAHGANRQRAFQIACLLYGAQPKAFGHVADAVELPDERREECEYEAYDNQRNWDRLLSAHFRPEDAPPGAGDVVPVVYEPTEHHADDQRVLRELGILEYLAEMMRTDYRFEPGIRIVALDCDEPNAFWDPETRELHLCYELVAYYRAQAAQIE